MLTYNQETKKKRIDRPWLLFLLVIVWIIGTVFFHSPWEPYEPFVFVIVKSIVSNNNWLVPYISNTPYLDIQPFYFWWFASIIKVFELIGSIDIANSIRLVNTLLIFLLLFVLGKTGSTLPAYKNGRTVILLFISTIGFINICYQLSPNIFILLGFSFFIYSLQKSLSMPGISGWILFLGLLFLSINFTCEYLLIGLIVLFILPIINKVWRCKNYFITTILGVFLFIFIFYLYVYELKQYDSEFYLQWLNKYINLFPFERLNLFSRINEILGYLLWFLSPIWLLVIWSIYKRRFNLFRDPILQLNIILFILTIVYATFSATDINNVLYPIVIFSVFISSVEVDSIKITIVSLFNWFSIFIFGLVGVIIWSIYIWFNFDTHNGIFSELFYYTQNYHYKFSLHNLCLAIIFTVVWLFMVTRKHIRGREMITNWASGSTFVIILFLSLCLPIFDNILSFRSVVIGSIKYLDTTKCIATNSDSNIQIPLWSYYANINLIPSFLSLNNTMCNQAVISTGNIGSIDTNQWDIVYQNKRPIDKKTYYVLKHR